MDQLETRPRHLDQHKPCRLHQEHKSHVTFFWTNWNHAFDSQANDESKERNPDVYDNQLLIISCKRMILLDRLEEYSRRNGVSAPPWELL